jgi:CxxC motif-containing protein (DUF1111 family)
VGGTGGASLGVVIRVGRLVDDGFDPLIGRGGPVARAHSVQELGYACALPSGIPAGANVTSVRAAPQLYGLGLVDEISDDTIRQGAAAEAEAVRGRTNFGIASSGQQAVGRFGWKADTADLQMFVAGALRTEQGVTNPLAPEDMVPTLPAGASPCAGQSTTPKDDGRRVQALSAFVASLPAPLRGDSSDPAIAHGADLFEQTGCAACHTPAMQSAAGPVPLYSDLLLHDMGSDLDDGVVEGNARGTDWRTTPLWGLGQRTRYLHDGRARTLPAAINAHGGQAAAAVAAFRALDPDEHAALLAFLASL